MCELGGSYRLLKVVFEIVLINKLSSLFFCDFLFIVLLIGFFSSNKEVGFWFWW